MLTILILSTVLIVLLLPIIQAHRKDHSPEQFLKNMILALLITSPVYGYYTYLGAEYLFDLHERSFIFQSLVKMINIAMIVLITIVFMKLIKYAIERKLKRKTQNER